ncbi:hypothetical protein DFH01_07555 [Falsiroseomonas bella]|uniref:Common-antigen outer membrane protein n=1 Tax=Falsiroseomonas bella TaxID=2184016 RepID=A0A317FN73_9PROT|nr:DVU3141 family protein [Falsiroseomonas bella]PWS39086.1 hypothetical protein DFH01_07555 [Falsiroseomonas bella]
MHILGSWRALRRSTGPRTLLPAILLLLGGCTAGGLGGNSEVASAAPPPPADPLTAFVAQAAPGTASRVVLADGRPATVRVARAYIAASGRECREVLIGTGSLERAQLLCQGEGGAWAQARPLLRGGGIPR